MEEYDKNCTVLIYRSHHHYIPQHVSVAASLVAAAAVASSTGEAISNATLPNGFPQQPNLQDLQARLEKKSDAIKYQALKEVVLWAMQASATDVASGACVGTNTGASVASRLLMTVIRFVLPSDDHRVLRMLQLYWELVNKTTDDGTLRDEMILVCNKLREDLLHPNEFVRGTTLRLLTKMRFVKILEPLIEAVIQNLNHHHAYVRRNAILCVLSMIRAFGVDILNNAPEEVERLLLVESDTAAKRNAFMVLIHYDIERAVNYALSLEESIAALGDVFQLAVLELLRKASREAPQHVPSLLRLVVKLVDTSSPAVKYGGSAALCTLSSSPIALKAAARNFVSLLALHGDNSVKLIVLDRIQEIAVQNRQVLEDSAVDILRALSCPSLTVRKKALGIALQLVTSRTVNAMLDLLRKELVKSLATEPLQEGDVEAHYKYLQLLVRAMRLVCQDRVVAGTPMPLLLDLLAHGSLKTAVEVASFVRQLIAGGQGPVLLPRVLETLPDVPTSRVARISLWLLAEYSETVEMRVAAINAIFQALAPLRFEDAGDSQKQEQGGAAPPPKEPKITTRTIVLPDGTYGTEDVYENSETVVAGEAEVPTSKLRSLIIGNDFLLASIISMTLAKLALKLYLSDDSDGPVGLSRVQLASSERDKFSGRTLELGRVKAIAVAAALLKFCSSNESCGPKSDTVLRIKQALYLLTQQLSSATVQAMLRTWFPRPRAALAEVLEVDAAAIANDEILQVAGGEQEIIVLEPDKIIGFRLLADSSPMAGNKRFTDIDDMSDLQIALGLRGSAGGLEQASLFQRRLERVRAMTGLADQVYVEAFLVVHHFDLVVELTVINRTNHTLQNVNVELATHGDLKILERPAPVTLAPGQSHRCHSTIKVQSTESGILFGHVTFDEAGAADKRYLVLNELPVDLLDFIQSRWLDDVTFRSLWCEFEWENKLTITPLFVTPEIFLETVMAETNMALVGQCGAAARGTTNTSDMLLSLADQPWHENPAMNLNGSKENKGPVALKGSAGLQRLLQNSSFVAVNLYSKSIFGEDALANVSLEISPEDGRLSGTVRIRSRSQGIALSLGDRITLVQRRFLRAPAIAA